ncbi:MAG: SIR2 family protein [Thermoanaerobaculia bacterium]
MSHDLADDLRAEIAKGHVLVVVGAGMSTGATQGDPLASWQGLLENGVERCVAVRGLDAKWASRVREEIRSGDLDDLLSAAEKVSSKLGFPDSGEYRRWLHDTVGKLELKDRSILDAIRDLGLPIATTNYDGLLEEVTHRPALTWRDGDKAARVIRGVEPGILHLHGYWEAPESVILGIRSYEHIRGNQYAQAVLRAIQTLHTLLFIGCGDGLDDPNFGALLAWAREAFRGAEARHYRLCRGNELEELREKHREERLFPISYGPKHGDLGPFVRSLGSFAVAVKKSDKAIPVIPPSRLPGRPRCFGREDEVRDLVETLLQPVPPPTPILGGPGSGKTTIALEALYDRRVAERFGPRRFFVRCDGAASREILVGEIARAVGIEPGSNPEASLFQALEAGPAALALDNSETPWEAATTTVEDLLSALSSVEGLALVASIRGDQRPLGPPWRSSIRVGPLGLLAAREAFLAVAGQSFRDDPDLERLLD